MPVGVIQRYFLFLQFQLASLRILLRNDALRNQRVVIGIVHCDFVMTRLTSGGAGVVFIRSLSKRNDTHQGIWLAELLRGFKPRHMVVALDRES